MSVHLGHLPTVGRGCLGGAGCSLGVPGAGSVPGVVDRGLDFEDLELGAERVAELHARGAIQLVDVREPDEWSESRIPGARHVELEELVKRSGTIARDAPVVFYCAFGARAALAAAAFRRAGYDAYSLVGGIVAWRTRELPVEPADESAAS